MTIKDLAAKTGYAVGTVSRVLNNHPNVSEKARAAILQAVEESGFQLNVNAKQLKQSHATSILVVVKGTGNELFAEMVESIQAQISQTRYPLHVDYMDEENDEVLRAVQRCREKKPLGILFLGGSSNHFRENFGKIDIPCVLVTMDASRLGFENLSSVYTDDAQATRQAADQMIAMGHRQFAVIGGPRELSDISRLRYEGFLESIREHGIAFDPERDYSTVRFNFQGGYQGTKELMNSGRKFTALLAASDVMAIGAIRALHDAGLRVPEDVSVMGYDGLPLGDYLVPKLSTVGQSGAQMAHRAVELLLEAVEQKGQARHEKVPFLLHMKESTRCLISE